ncbi:MAG: hypothetical protein JW821_16775 [Deltaproteobacteria bacterium]|nr:hypothetical protein [Deltaproteobacteria bacterium]
MKNILFLIDDKRTIRLLYEESLAPEGLEIMATASLEGLPDKIQGFVPDFVVLDSPRWELLKESPAFRFELVYFDSDYYVVKTPESTGIILRVGTAFVEGQECLQLVLAMSAHSTTSHDHAAAGKEGHASLHRLGAIEDWDSSGWELAQNQA